MGEVEVLVADLKFHILQENSGIIQCNEAQKELVKLNVPKRVTLPNGRTFVARYKRIRRGELPPNIVMRRTYTQRLRQEVEDVEERNKDKEFLNL